MIWDCIGSLPPLPVDTPRQEIVVELKEDELPPTPVLKEQEAAVEDKEVAAPSQQEETSRVDVVVYTLPNCSPCTRQFQELNGMSYVTRGQKEAPAYIRRFPTTVLYKEGKPVKRFVGVVSRKTLQKTMKELE